MNVQQLHIDFDIKIQKVSTNVNDNFKPEEKDWLLYDTLLKYIESNFTFKPETKLGDKKVSFQTSKSKYDNIEELVSKVKLSVYKDEDGSVFATLPSDYFKMVDDRSITLFNCNGIAITEVNEDVHIFPVPFLLDTALTNLYDDFKITLVTTSGTIVLFDINDYPQIADGINGVEERFYLINLAIEEINRLHNDIEVRYEKYNQLYYRETLVFISTNPDYISIDFQASLSIQSNTPFINNQEVKLATVTKTTGDKDSNRLTKSEDVLNVLNYSFSKTRKDSPVSELARGKVIVYHNDTFIPSEIELVYIRKPRRIDYKLETTIEANPNIHEKIVDLTIERISGLIESRNRQNLILNNKDLE